VIDTGPDFRQQMLREEVHELDAILYTHEHRDHVAGLDDIRPFNFLTRKPVELYGENRVLEALKEMVPYAFNENKYPGAPDINMNRVGTREFTIEGVKFIPIRVLHYKLPVLGFRTGDFTYITDANYIPEEEKKKISGSKCMVVNALRQKKHISHFSLSDALKVVEEFNPVRAYFTHISHQMGLHSKVNSGLPDHIGLAYDRLTIEI
jgi:phosphoribosyl 1,2-cyclic phosphate phosphodiesterase